MYPTMAPTTGEALQGNLTLARCVGVDETDGVRGVEAEWTTAEGQSLRRRLPCLSGARVAAGDQVLLAPVSGAQEWVVMGALGSPQEEGAATALVLPASKFRIEGEAANGEDRLVLRRPSGQVELEIRIVDGRTHLRCPTRDAVLECEGTLELRAGEALRMKSSQYELQVTGDARVDAGGKFQVEAAEQELRSRGGEIRLNADKNLVLWGEFLLLNTKDETPWTSKT